jgi:hypothetical protein
MTINHDWQALSDTWRNQTTPSIDLDALRREVGKQGRYLRRMLALEVGTTVLMVAFFAWALMRPENTLFERLLFGVGSAVMILYQGYVLWIRRRELSDTGLDAQALLDLEIRRANTTHRYWRVGMWLGLALWLVIYAALMVGLQQGWDKSQVAGLAGGLAANVLVFPLAGIFGHWRCRQATQRRVRYQQLLEQLRAP